MGILTFLDAIPEFYIAITVYIVGSMIILASWYSIALRLPKFLGGLTWLLLFTILATPTVSVGQNAEIAPAFCGLLFGILTKDYPIIWTNLSLLCFVFGLGCLIGFAWTKYKSDSNSQSKNPL